ncbi:MAG: BrnA antitoxin family protein [Phycisphaerales bacterium]
MKKIPKFRSEAAERRFWREHDSADYMDWSIAQQATLPKLKPSTHTISLRLPEAMLDALKILANQRDIPYQSLLKAFLAERLKEELQPNKG